MFTNVKKKIFKKSHIGTNSNTIAGNYDIERHGVFFSDNKHFAKIYGNHVKDFELKIDNIATNLRELAYRCYRDEEFEMEPATRDEIKWLTRGNNSEWHLFDDDVGETFVAWLKEQGYDGAAFEEYQENQEGEEIGGTTYVVFDPIDIVPVNRSKQLDMFAVNERKFLNFFFLSFTKNPRPFFLVSQMLK